MRREAASDFNLIRRELTRLTDLPPWGRPQGDHWDRLSNFVYRIKTLHGVQRQARARAKAEGLKVESFEAYAVRRWYNHHTHDQILKMLLAHPGVQPEENRKHRTIDFYLQGIPFDLKISRFPGAYPEPIEFAEKNPHHLALWQYEHQSKQGRYHTGNRLFMILHNLARPALTWQQRRDFESVRVLLERFLANPTLLGLTLSDHHTGEIYRPWSAVIFFIK